MYIGTTSLQVKLITITISKSPERPTNYSQTRCECRRIWIKQRQHRENFEKTVLTTTNCCNSWISEVRVVQKCATVGDLENAATLVFNCKHCPRYSRERAFRRFSKLVNLWRQCQGRGLLGSILGSFSRTRFRLYQNRIFRSRHHFKVVIMISLLNELYKIIPGSFQIVVIFSNSFHDFCSISTSWYKQPGINASIAKGIVDACATSWARSRAASWTACRVDRDADGSSRQEQASLHV